jgi:hypothetical protein
VDSTGRRLTVGTLLARFPLVQRSRPPGLPLEVRVRELRELATQSGDQISRAAEVCNKAALIASDCDLTDLARALCWRQHDVFERARPLPAAAAKLALQPVLNLPRQLIRQGDGQGAYSMLEALYLAARDQTDAVIGGRCVNLREVTCGPDDHKTICTLVWAALLADGARALALAGRWREAAECMAAHRGVGLRLLDGRQVTIISFMEQADDDQALALIEDSVIAEPWEQAVASALRVLCRSAAGGDIEQDVAAMLTHALDLVHQNDPSTVVFRNRVGITAFDLADGYGRAQTARVRVAVVAAASTDAYAAREVLAHPVLRSTLTASAERDLATLVEASGLGRGAIPQAQLDDLITSVALAESHLYALLNRG